MDGTSLFDEVGHAGREHLDEGYVAEYDAKAGVDVLSEIELLKRHGLGPEATLVDMGAGTGLIAAAAAPFCRRVVAVDASAVMLARAAARASEVECVEAGFLTYEHQGPPPEVVYSRNALHHLPDYWKAVALSRLADMLLPGGTLVLRDLIYAFEPADADDVLEAWFSAASTDSTSGWTRAELETHVRNEYSTFSWLLEPMLEHAGFEIRDAWYADSRAYARYICTKP